MKKTTQIHIGGRHFFIDEDACQKLSHYIDSLKRHFAADGEAGKEIVDDIEQRIAELFGNKIVSERQPLTLDNMNEVIQTLGTVEDFVYHEENSDKASREEAGRESYHENYRDHRRFYRDPENNYLGGVCSGLGEYFQIDPLWIRLAFVLLAFAKGIGIIIYLILWIVVPKARTTAEKLQMRGKPVNLGTIKDTINEEYERVKTGFDGFSKSETANHARNGLENLGRAIGLIIVAIFKFIIGFIGIFLLVMGSIFLAGLIMMVMGFTTVFGHFAFWDGINLPNLADFFVNSGHYYTSLIALVVVILIPIIALIYGGVKILFDIRTKHPVLRATMLTAWILAFVLFITLLIMNAPLSAIEASGSQTSLVETGNHSPVIIDVNDNTQGKRMTHYHVMGYRFNHSEWDDALYDNAVLHIGLSSDDNMHLNVQQSIKNVDMDNAERHFDDISYHWEVKDSVLLLNQYFRTDEEDFWMFADVNITLRVPADQEIVITENTCNMLNTYQRASWCNELGLAGKKCTVSAEGALVPVP